MEADELRWQLRSAATTLAGFLIAFVTGVAALLALSSGYCSECQNLPSASLRWGSALLLAGTCLGFALDVSRRQRLRRPTALVLFVWGATAGAELAIVDALLP